MPNVCFTIYDCSSNFKGISLYFENKLLFLECIEILVSWLVILDIARNLVYISEYFGYVSRLDMLSACHMTSVM